MTLRPADVRQLFDLTQRVVVMTGAGGQLAEQMLGALAGAGATLALADGEIERCKDRARALGALGVQADAFSVDVREEGSVRSLIDAVLGRWNRIDVLINAAGRTHFKTIAELSLEQWREVYESNVTGTFLCCKAVLPSMRAQGSGSIVNVGSIYGVVGADQRIYGSSGINSSPAYAAAKGGIINLTRHLAVDVASSGVRVNCISPGGFYAGQDPEFVRQYAYRTPLGRMGNETDLMGAILFLSSDASAYVTGHNLVMDGGWTAW